MASRLPARSLSLRTVRGTDVSVEIENFVLSAHNVLDGKIIRSTNDDGTYLVGCQMPEDNIYIMEYVESQLRG